MLTWVSETRGLWTAGNWEIYVGSDGDYSVHVAGSGPFSRIGVHGSLAEAKDYCEQQEREAAPPAESPKVGDVWGVPGKPETWRYISRDLAKWVGFFGWGGLASDTWQSWLHSSGAVRIDDGGETADNWREELAKFTDLLEYAKSELDAERAKVAALEAEVVRLRERCKKAGQTTHWSLRDRAETAERRQKELEAEVARLRDNQCPHDYGWLKKQAADGEREIASMTARMAELEAEVKAKDETAAYLTKRLAEETKANDNLWIRMHTAEKERDDARAAWGRLMDALRGIEREAMPANCEPMDMYAALSRVGVMAREAIKREEPHPLQSLRDAGGSGWDVIDDPVGYLERREEGVKS